MMFSLHGANRLPKVTFLDIADTPLHLYGFWSKENR